MPFDKVAADICHVRGKAFLVLICMNTDWKDIFYLPNISAKMVNKALSTFFLNMGAPQFLHSDGGKQFDCRETRAELAKWGARLVTSSPFFAQSNGKAESAVKQAKRVPSIFPPNKISRL